MTASEGDDVKETAQAPWVIVHWPLLAAVAAGLIAWGNINSQMVANAAAIEELKATIAGSVSAADARLRDLEVNEAGWSRDMESLRGDLIDLKQALAAQSAQLTEQNNLVRQLVARGAQGNGQ